MAVRCGWLRMKASTVWWPGGVARSGRTRSSMTVIIEMTASRLTVFVSDDGVGFDPSAPQLRARHLGLTSMEERAGALGGTLQVTSARGEGSSIRAEVPVDT